YVDGVGFSSDANILFTTSRNWSVCRWNALSGDLLSTIRHPGAVHWATTNNVGLAATACGDGRIRLFDLSSGSALQRDFEHRESVQRVVFSPNGRYLASSSDDRTVRLWDVATGKSIGPSLIHKGSGTWGLAIRPDGAQLAVASGNSIFLWPIAPPLND